MIENQDNLVNRIEIVLNLMHISKTEFYSDLGLSKQTLPNWRKRSLPSSEILIKMSDYLDVDPSWLLTGEISKKHDFSSGDTFSGDKIVKRIYKLLSDKNSLLTPEDNEFFFPLNNCVSKEELTKWRLGMKVPSFSLLDQVSINLGCSLDYLISGKCDISRSDIPSEYIQLSEKSRDIVDSVIRKISKL